MTKYKEAIHLFDEDKIPSGLNRRSFLKRLGGGVTIAMTIGGYSVLEASTAEGEYNVYLHIKEDGRVNCLTGKIEMGQGINTSLAQSLGTPMHIDSEPRDHSSMCQGSVASLVVPSD